MSEKLKPPFLGLSEQDLSALSQRAVTRAYPKNTIIVHEGDLTDSLYIILAGKVKVFLANQEGKEIVLDTQGPGEYFGEMVLDAVKNDDPYIFTHPDLKMMVDARYQQIASSFERWQAYRNKL